MAKEKNENKINLKEMVMNNESTVKTNKTEIQGISKMLEDIEKPHNFKNSISINKKKEIENLDDLLSLTTTEHHIRIPFTGMNFISLRYTKDQLEDIIKNDKFLNPKVQIPKNALSIFDSMLIESKYVSEETKEDLIDKCIDKKVDVELNGERISTTEDEEVHYENLINSIHLDKNGQTFILLNNKVMIRKFINVTSIAGSLMTFQKSLNKGVLPQELIALTGTLYTDGDNENITIGRIGQDLALKIDLNLLFKQIILPKIIVESGFKSAPSFEHSIIMKNRYSSAIAINSSFDPKDEIIGFSIQTSKDLPYDVYVERENFLCVNSSILNENIKSILENRVISYIMNNIVPEGKITVDELQSMDIKIKMVPISALSKHCSSKGVPLSDMITINSYTSPLYLPIIEVNKNCFISNKKNALFNSWLFEEAGFKKPDIEKICTVFGRFFPNSDPFLSETGFDDRLSIIPDIKRLVMSIFIEDTDKFNRYAISVTNKENITSCALQID